MDGIFGNIITFNMLSYHTKLRVCLNVFIHPQPHRAKKHSTKKNPVAEIKLNGEMAAESWLYIFKIALLPLLSVHQRK